MTQEKLPHRKELCLQSEQCAVKGTLPSDKGTEWSCAFIRRRDEYAFNQRNGHYNECFP